MKAIAKAARRHISHLRFHTGTLLRISADVLAIWTGLLAGTALAVAITPRTLAGWGTSIELVFALISVICCASYVVAGLYSDARSLSVAAKLERIIGVNLACYSGVALGWLAVGQWLYPQASNVGVISLLMASFAVSSGLIALARLVSLALRSDRFDIFATGYRPQVSEDKVLVVGGCGYIGSSLVEMLLDKGKSVLVLDALHYGEAPLARVAKHPNLTIIKEDYRNVEALTRAMDGVGSVVHLGGLVGDPACAVDPDLTTDMNVTSTKLIGEIAKACGVRRFVFASSCSVYGACDDIVDERSGFNPQSLYARSKVASEAILAPLNDKNFAVTRLRFSTVYGISGRVRFDLVVNLLCAKAILDKVITVFGPDQWRPFVHVDDVARSIAITLEAPVEKVAGEVFNVGSDEQNFTLGEVARMIKKQVPDAEITEDHEFKDTRNYRVSFAKIRDELGFTPRWTVERGITQVTSLVASNHIGHYSLPVYSNVLQLKEMGPKSCTAFQISGWEDALMDMTDMQPDVEKPRATAA